MNEMIQRVIQQGVISRKEKNLVTQTLNAKRAHLTDSIRKLKMELLEEEQALGDVRDCLVAVGDLRVEG